MWRLLFYELSFCFKLVGHGFLKAPVRVSSILRFVVWKQAFIILIQFEIHDYRIFLLFFFLFKENELVRLFIVEDCLLVGFTLFIFFEMLIRAPLELHSLSNEVS